MVNLVWVGLGGFIGSILRYLLGGFVNRLEIGALFPFGTLVVNVVGCLAIGFLVGMADSKGFLSLQGRLLLFTGVLGGFTTFSTFAYETVQLFRVSQGAMAAINIFLQGAFGLGGVWVGETVSRWVRGINPF